ncbi:hypothetical protein BU15DRAFT_66872 [Melanogaster broomeanus]|nr:hypothetical protein BU15DRAFT_66872 [Melanogaster broomeanus]
MPYEVELENGAIVQVEDLAVDGRNWTTYREKIVYVAKLKGVVGQYDGTDVKPVDATQHEFMAWDQRNRTAKLILITTIPDSLLHVTHLETAHEWFQNLANLFEMKKSDVTQREATRDPRTLADTRPKHSEDAHHARDRETASNKPKSATAAEPRDSTRRKRKRKAGEQGKVEKRDRRGRKAAEGTSEQEAAAREPGEEAMDGTRSISLAVTPSSQDDDSRDIGVPCSTVEPHKPETTHPTAGEATTGTTSAGPTGPVGIGQQPHVTRQDHGEGKGEDTVDQTADSISLAPPASSHVNAKHKTSCKPAKEDPPSSLLEGEQDGRTSTPEHAARGGASLLEAEQLCTERPQREAPAEAAAAAATTTTATAVAAATAATATTTTTTVKVHPDSVQAEPPSSAHEWNGRAMSGRTRVPDGIVEDPAGCVEPSTPEEPPSVPLEGSGLPRGARAAHAQANSTAQLRTAKPQSEHVKAISMCIGYTATYLSHAHHLRNTRSDPSSPPTRHADADDSKRDPRKSIEYARMWKRAPGYIGTILGQSGPPDPLGIDHRCWGAS